MKFAGVGDVGLGVVGRLGIGSIAGDLQAPRSECGACAEAERWCGCCGRHSGAGRNGAGQREIHDDAAVGGPGVGGAGDVPVGNEGSRILTAS